MAYAAITMHAPMAGCLLPDTGASRKRPPLAFMAAPIRMDVSASTATRVAHVQSYDTVEIYRRSMRLVV